jgi:hypothetical protein
VQQLTMLVTAEGKWVLPQSEEFLSALGDPDPDYDAVGFAVRNLGYVKFQVLDHLVTEIELHPRNVDLRALLAVQAQLDKVGTNLFRIKYLTDDWHSEISPSAEHTAARLSELCAPVFEPAATERFHVEPQDYAKLWADRDSPLRLLGQKWRASFGRFDPNLMSFAIDHQLLSRIMIAEISMRTMDSRYRFIGDGFTWLDRSFPFCAVGQQLEDMPDKDYGAWIAEFYKAVATSGQPRYDVVTATIQGPSGDDKPQPTSYERLLLPWKTPSDRVVVTLLSRTFSEKSESEFASLAAEMPAVRKLVKSS